jgi:H+/Cl- antiporter ClcA
MFGHNENINYWLRYATWIVFNVSCVMLSACVGYFTQYLMSFYREYLSRDAEGSGLPEMKAVLAGVHLSKFLSINALIGKFIGVTIAIIGGLSFGRYGAFVHMSSVIAY